MIQNAQDAKDENGEEIRQRGVDVVGRVFFGGSKQVF